MRVNILRDKLDVIEASFKVLLEDNNNKASIEDIKDVLENSFDGFKFNISIVPHKSNEKTYIMSIFPEESTMDKIIVSILDEKDSKDVVKDLWSKNKNWYIEIDSSALDGSFTNKELAAILLHEIGHITISNSIPNRISTILQYNVMSTNSKNKLMLRDKVFRSILKLPILEMCVKGNSKSNIKEEIKADGFAKKLGYGSDLESALNKIMDGYKSSKSLDDKIFDTAKFSLQNLEDFRKRKHNLTKKSLFALKEAVESPYIENIISEYISNLYEDVDSGSFAGEGKNLELMESRADYLTSPEYIAEFVIFKHKLNRLEPSDIDYIEVKTNNITSDTDKMMLLNYLHSKLDTCEYYISLLEDPKTSKKYDIPNGLNELYSIRSRLFKLKDRIIRYQYPEKSNGMYIQFGQSLYV
jgi:hypothetical protein